MPLPTALLAQAADQARGLTIDADPLPFTQGKIIAADPVARTVALQVDPGYDDLDRSDMTAITQLPAATPVTVSLNEGPTPLPGETVAMPAQVSDSVIAPV